MFDLIIIGGSAAASSAGIYAARRNLNFRIVTKEFGGEVATSGEIGNWPGINKTDGLTLVQQFKDHLAFYGVEPEEGIEVKSIVKQEDGSFCIQTKTGETPKTALDKIEENPNGRPVCDYVAKAVIIATGVRPRELNIPGEKEYRNKGVTYCTVCDGPLFPGKVTAVVGGGNSAMEAGLMLADIASKVYLINKNPQFKGDAILLEKLKARPNVEIIYDALVGGISGEMFVTGLTYVKDGREHELKVDGVFVHIGMLPNSGMVPAEVEKNNFGEIKVNLAGETSVPGLYAAGDVTDIPHKQIVIAAGQGTAAALSAVNYLNKLK
jgi:alkyl hydroperoxide reductase subunit AhpF